MNYNDIITRLFLNNQQKENTLPLLVVFIKGRELDEEVSKQ